MFAFLAALVCMGDPRLNGMRGDENVAKAPSVPVLGPDGKPTYENGYIVLTPGPDLTGDALTAANAYADSVKATLKWFGNSYLAKKYGLAEAPELDANDTMIWEIQQAVMVYGITQIAAVLPPEVIDPGLEGARGALRRDDAKPAKPSKPRDLRAELKALPAAERPAFLASLPAAERDALLASLLG